MIISEGINLPHYPEDVIGTFGKLSRHLIMANGSYNRETGEQELEKGIAGMVSYGTLYLANPDLTKRFELNALKDRATMYGGAEGYTDYATWN